MVNRGKETDDAAGAVPGSAGIGCRDGCRSAEQLVPIREIERVQPVDDASRGVLRHRFDIDGVAAAIDDRGGGDSIGADIAARQVRGWRFPDSENRLLPKNRGGTATDALSVNRIYRVVFRSHIQNVLVSLPGNRKLVDEQGLTIDLAIYGELTDFPKSCCIHVAGGQRRFIQILPGALDVVVIGEHVGGGWPRTSRSPSVQHGLRGTAASENKDC